MMGLVLQNQRPKWNPWVEVKWQNPYYKNLEKGEILVGSTGSGNSQVVRLPLEIVLNPWVRLGKILPKNVLNNLVLSFIIPTFD